MFSQQFWNITKILIIGSLSFLKVLNTWNLPFEFATTIKNITVPFSGHGAFIPKSAKICIQTDWTKIFAENFHNENLLL